MFDIRITFRQSTALCSYDRFSLQSKQLQTDNVSSYEKVFCRSLMMLNPLLKTLRSMIILNCNANICAYGQMPQFEGKDRRVIDNSANERNTYETI
jgi:hypothetical protein